jgi:hypothetical protein
MEFFERAEIAFPGASNPNDAARLKHVITVLVDDNYSPVDIDTLKALLTSDVNLIVPENPQLPDNNDCDDYAIYLKAMMTVRLRNAGILGAHAAPPPALGIVISQTHATNVFIGLTESGNPYVGMLDTSEQERDILRSAKAARDHVGTLPLQLIYM